MLGLCSCCTNWQQKSPILQAIGGKFADADQCDNIAQDENDVTPARKTAIAERLPLSFSDD